MESETGAMWAACLFDSRICIDVDDRSLVLIAMRIYLRRNVSDKDYLFKNIYYYYITLMNSSRYPGGSLVVPASSQGFKQDLRVDINTVFLRI